nr:B12D protein [Ipomoea batatas]
MYKRMYNVHTCANGDRRGRCAKATEDTTAKGRRPGRTATGEGGVRKRPKTRRRRAGGLRERRLETFLRGCATAATEERRRRSASGDLEADEERIKNESRESLHQATQLSSMATSRWIRPEVYPLFAAMSVAVGICGFQLIRNLTTNPEVRVNKEGRAAGVLENYEEGKKYAEHSLRKFVRNKSPEIMPSLNRFFSDPQRN